MVMLSEFPSFVDVFSLKIMDDQDQERELFDKNYVSPIPAGKRWRDWAANPEGITWRCTS